MSINFRKTALAAAMTLAAAGAQAGVLFNDGLDGSLFDPAASGRGVMVDFIPSGNLAGATGAGTYFGIAFTYAANGAPLWVTFQNETTAVNAGTAVIADMPVRLFNGGSFGNPFSAPSNSVVGSATVTVNSCESTLISLDMTEASGLADVSFDYGPIGVSGGCTSTATLSQCPATTTAVGNDCQLPSTISGNLYLPAGKKYLVEGQVSVADGAVLTIAPGVTVQGSTNNSVPNFLAVLQGGKIYADGTASAPITFTGPQATKGSWAGVVLAGRSTCNTSAGGALCAFEAVPSIMFGGNQVNDSSGSISYARILYAGQAVAPDEELNALTLLGVGAGTRLSHIQVDHGDDDGFEWFGGSVNGDHLVCSNMTDDCFDMDLGYNGNLQFLLAYQGDPDGSFTGDPHGMEIDNNRQANDATPRTSPSIANATLIGASAGANGEGIRLRRGAAGAFRGVVINGYADRCLNLDDVATFTQGGSATAQGPGLTLQNSFIGACAGGVFEDNAADAYLVSAWYGAGNANQSGAASLRGAFMPSAGAPYLEGNQVPADAFFTPVPYKGAFAGPFDSWQAGWTVNLPAN